LLCFPAENGLKSSEKRRKIFGRSIASTKCPELAGTGHFRVGLFNLGKQKDNISDRHERKY
jgi:hypothetical protein